MTFDCPICGEAYDAPPKTFGKRVVCPSCRRAHICGAKTASVPRVRDDRPAKEDDHLILCFILGLLFNVLGVLAASIIGKGRGMLWAFYGTGIDAIVMFFAWKACGGWL